MIEHEQSSIGPLEAKIAAWAERQPDVRAALLIGSRATPQGARDGYSDHDVILFVESGSRLARKDDWLDAFGRPLIVLNETTEQRGEIVPTRLVQYRGGHRIDFTLSRVDLLHRIAEQEALPDWLAAGYRILLDRDGDAAALPPPSASAYVPRPPTSQEYRALVNEFWWETLYVGKYVARNELLPARYSLETVLRYRCLVPMLEWYVQIPREWEQSVGVRGRGLRWLLELEDREVLDRTYAADTLASHGRALDAMIELFRKAARAVARDLGLHYPAILDEETVRLLKGEKGWGQGPSSGVGEGREE